MMMKGEITMESVYKKNNETRKKKRSREGKKQVCFWCDAAYYERLQSLAAYRSGADATINAEVLMNEAVKQYVALNSEELQKWNDFARRVNK